MTSCSYDFAYGATIKGYTLDGRLRDSKSYSLQFRGATKSIVYYLRESGFSQKGVSLRTC